jgi:hypothetical protein
VSAFSGLHGTIFPLQAPFVFAIQAWSIVADCFGTGGPTASQ